MTYITSLRVQNFRIHSDYHTQLGPQNTAIIGKNGSGKTSLLEAIYIGLQGVSFRGTDKDIVRKQADWYRIDLELAQPDSNHIITYDSKKAARQKQYVLNQKTSYRLSSSQKYPVVLFEPDDLQLISGSPSRRRRFIDLIISQIDPTYRLMLHKYERALKQRNSLLKQESFSNDSLFAWNVALSEYGSYILEKRVLYVEELNKKLTMIYQNITSSPDSVTITYATDINIQSIKQNLLHKLELMAERDKILGVTTIGPHRDDLVFQFNMMPALAHASRGENRSIILALKFFEATQKETTLNKKPIILLDDVLGELDSRRQAGLLRFFNDNQIIITANEANPGETFFQVRL